MIYVVVLSTVLRDVPELSTQVEILSIGELNAAALRGYYECV
jgi:hypothetical protein